MQILIIEDEKRLADALGQIMQEARYQADIVYDGRDGLAYASSGDYDVIVLDVMLPGMDGFEVVHHLRESKISTPVIMLTALDDVKNKITGLDSGADDYMTKPFSPSELVARVKAHLARYERLGGSGKKNPRMGIDFIKWLDADSVVKIISNVYAYAQKYIDPEVPGGKEHIGYIVDRTGTEEFLRWIMKDVNLPPKAEIYKPLYWDGIRYSGLK